MAVASASAIASAFWLEAFATAKAKASAMDLATPSAEATAFAALPGAQLEPATRASVSAMAMAIASANASALACTAATQQASVSRLLRFLCGTGRVSTLLNKILSRALPCVSLPRRLKQTCTLPGGLPYQCSCVNVLAFWGLFKRHLDSLLECQRFLRSR